MAGDLRSFVNLQKPLELKLIAGQQTMVVKVNRMNAEEWRFETDSLNATSAVQKALVDYELRYGNSLVRGRAELTEVGLVADGAEQRAAFLDILHRLRKEQHIGICAEQNVEASTRTHGFENVTLNPVALPDLSWDEICTKRVFMGRVFQAPILITGMTGGVERASEINDRLARAAVEFDIPMGVGSQRLALENSQHESIFSLKKKFPKLFLIGNIGIGQLRSPNYLDLCHRAVAMIGADALAIHVNVLQELVQVEGDRDFRDIRSKIGVVAKALSVPVLVKEVGAGLDATTALALSALGIRYFDVGGVGGTSWAHIEGLRSSDPVIARLGKTFRNWGLSTRESLESLVALKLQNTEFVATGGIRDGVTILKAIKCGASMAGIGLPLFKAALESEDGPKHELAAIIHELKIAMMCTGLKNLN